MKLTVLNNNTEIRANEVNSEKIRLKFQLKLMMKKFKASLISNITIKIVHCLNSNINRKLLRQQTRQVITSLMMAN